MASRHPVVQGNLNNFAGLVACQQACIAGTQAPKQAAPSSGVEMPAADELVFLTSALTANAWLTLDATSVRGSTHRIRHIRWPALLDLHCPKGLLLGVLSAAQGPLQLFSVQRGVRAVVSKLTAT